MDRQRRDVTTVIVMERSFFSNRWVFTELAKERGYLTRVDYEHLSFFFDVCVNGWRHFPRIDAIFLLQAPVAEVNDRLLLITMLVSIWLCFLLLVLGASAATRS